MKKRILSLILLVVLFVFNVSALASENDATVTEKDIMEEYIRTLISADYIKYSMYPFEEYNEAVEEHILNKSIGFEAFLKVLNDLGSDSYKEAFATLCGQSTFSTKEFYKVFSDYLATVAEPSDAEARINDYDESVDWMQDYNKTALTIIDEIDDFNEQTEIKKIYEQTHQTALEGTKFFKDANEGLTVVSYIDKILAASMRDYSQTAKYIDVMCDYIDAQAKSIIELAGNDESQIHYANSMVLAMAEVRTSYYDRFISTLKEVDKAMLGQMESLAQDAINKKLKSWGLGCFLGVFEAVDTTLFVKDLLMNVGDLNEKIDASSKIQASYPITLGLQGQFYSEGRNRLSDGSFSDEDYEYMKTLFELCRASQINNYRYLDIQSNQTWIDTALNDLDTSKKSHLNNSTYIEKYINQAKGNFDIHENVGEIDGIYEGHTYKVILTPMDYTEAIRYCENVGGHLATIDSEGEYKYLQNIIDSVDYRDGVYSRYYLTENNYHYDDATILLGTLYMYDISNDISKGRYQNHSEYKKNNGFLFICEWDSYDETAQTEKVLLRDKGQCGDNAFWELTIYGTMRIYGSGPMYNSILTDADFDSAEKNNIPSRLISTRYTDTKKLIVEDGITSLSCGAFQNHSSLTEVILPDTITSIGAHAFSQCENLQYINIPNNVKYIGMLAFSNCKKLQNINLSGNISKIGTQAFGSCHSLTDIVMSNSITTLGRNAFTDCQKLKSIKLSSGLEKIDHGTFQKCISLSEVIIPNGIISIGQFVFFECKSLTNITIPNSVKRIDSNSLGTFESTNIKTLVFPESVEYLGLDAFDTDAVESIYILNPTCKIEGQEWDFENKFAHRKIYGYENSTAHQWVQSHPTIRTYTGGEITYEFIPITAETQIPYQDNNKTPTIEDTTKVPTIETAKNDVKVTVNGKQVNFDVQPQIINNRTMIPVRAVAEALGAQVEWNEEWQTVAVICNNIKTGKKIVCGIQIDSPTMYWGIDGETASTEELSTTQLDSPAVIIDGRTLVPIRAIAELYGYQVEWDNTTRTVVICPDNSDNTSNESEVIYPVKDNQDEVINEDSTIVGETTEAIQLPDNGIYTVWGSLDHSSMNEGFFEIEYSENFVGSKVTPDYPLNITIDISDVDFDVFRDPDTLKPHKVTLTIRNNYDDTFYVMDAKIADEFVPESGNSPNIEVSDDIKVVLDGKQLQFDVEPIIVSGRTLVPLRVIFEALGAEVLWDDATRKVTAYRGPTTVHFYIDNYNIGINGISHEIDSCPIIKNDRTLIPLRAVTEAFGCQVEWIAETKTVVITSTETLEDLKGLYRVQGRFTPTSSSVGNFTIESSHNFKGELITSNDPVTIKVDVSVIGAATFYNFETATSYYVQVLIKDNEDGTYEILHRDFRDYSK